MTALTRRTALVSAGAAAVAGVPGATQGENPVLLALCAEWHRLRDIEEPLWAESHRVRDEADAHSDCPDLGTPIEVSMAHWERFGWNDLFDRANVANLAGCEVAKRLFDEPAYTSRGVLEKIRVMLRVEARSSDPEAYPPYDQFAEILGADFERLLGGLPS